MAHSVVLLFRDFLSACDHFGVRRLVAAFFFRGGNHVKSQSGDKSPHSKVRLRPKAALVNPQPKRCQTAGFLPTAAAA